MSILKNKIIVTNNLNQAEMLKTLAKNDIKTFNVRIMNIKELCDYCLMKCGKTINKELVDDNERIITMYNVLKAKNSNINISDAVNTLQIIDEAQGIDLNNKPKSAEIDDIIVEYYRNIPSSKIDLIGYLKEFNNIFKYLVFSLDNVYVYGSFSILEMQILNLITNNNIHNFSDLLTKNNNSNIQFIDGFGIVNEVSGAIKQVYDNNWHFDECTFICNNTNNYFSSIYNKINELKIPTTFSFGYPVRISNPGRFVKCIVELINNKFGKEYWDKLIDNESFNIGKLPNDEIHNIDYKSYKDYIGSLRLSFNDCDNQLKIDELNKIIHDGVIATLLKDFSFDLVNIYEFVKKYCFIRNDQLRTIDLQALVELKNTYDVYEKYFNGDQDKLIELLKIYLAKNVNNEFSQNGKLHVCNTSSALGCLRKHIFILGLSSTYFPSKYTENYLMTNKMYDDYCSKYLSSTDSSLLPTSTNKTKNEKEGLKNLIEIVPYILNNSDLYLCYSSYDLSENKKDNPSSIFYDYYQQAGNDIKLIGNEKDNIIHCSFINTNIGLENNFNVKEDPEKSSNKTKNYSVSASKLQDYNKCQLLFYFEKILGIYEEDDEDNFALIPANDLGTLIHDCLKQYVLNNLSKQDFLDLLEQKYNEYFIIHVPLNTSLKDKELDKLLSYMDKAFDVISRKKFCNDGTEYYVEKEVELKNIDYLLGLVSSETDSVLGLNGIIDAVEEREDGIYVVDYKCKNKFDHEKDDFESCIQGIFYCYILDHILDHILGRNADGSSKVKGCEFVYLKQNGTIISCEYNDTMKDKLETILKELINSINTFNYSNAIETAKNEDGNPIVISTKKAAMDKKDFACKYCKFKTSCQKFMALKGGANEA